MSTIARPDRKLVNHGAQLNPTVQRLYSIFLWDLTSEAVVTNSSLDPAFATRRRENAEYFFEVAPKVHEISEPFTTRVIATQNGGKFIESQGSLFKDIRIQGTTGLRPRKASPTVIPLLSVEPFQSLVQGFGNQVAEIPSSEVTGFDDIHFLRNIFRHYSDLKLQGRKVVMVWRNIKDDDYWIVEPKEFKLVQNSKSPLTYEYQINFHGVSKFTGNANVDIEQDPLAVMRSYNRLMTRIQGFQQNLMDAFLVVSTNISRIQGAGYFTINNITGPLTAVIKGLASVTTSSKQTAYGLLTACRTGIDNLSEAIDTLKTVLEEDSRDSVIRSLRRSVVTFCQILTEPTFQDSVSSTYIGRTNRAAASYSRRGGLDSTIRRPPSGGSPALPHSGSVAHVAEDRVRSGEDITDIARRLLNDARRWKEIVLLNDLRSPYITENPNPDEGILTVGDPILYPSTGVDTLSINISNPSAEEGSTENTILSQTYGRDLRLRSVTDGDLDFTDLTTNQRGDLSTIVGVDNVQQAVRIKFATEQGDLPAHPFFGSRFPIGNKADSVSFHTFRINTISTFLSDSRISEISDLNFLAVEDTLSVSANLKLIDSTSYVSTNFAVRRF